MKRKILWILLALVVVAALIFVIARPKNTAGDDQAASDPETASEQETVSETEQQSEPADAPEEIAEEEQGSENEGELPIDDSVGVIQTGSDSAEEPSDPGTTSSAEPTPNIDPETGIELEEDELPIQQP